MRFLRTSKQQRENFFIVYKLRIGIYHLVAARCDLLEQRKHRTGNGSRILASSTSSSGFVVDRSTLSSLMNLRLFRMRSQTSFSPRSIQLSRPSEHKSSGVHSQGNDNFTNFGQMQNTEETLVINVHWSQVRVVMKKWKERAIANTSEEQFLKSLNMTSWVCYTDRTRKLRTLAYIDPIRTGSLV